MAHQCIQQQMMRGKAESNNLNKPKETGPLINSFYCYVGKDFKAQISSDIIKKREGEKVKNLF